MKQVCQNYKSGAITLGEVAAPRLRACGVLVRSLYSVISFGTEGMKVREGKMSYVGKARARPDQVKKLMESVQQQGLLSTYRKAVNKLDTQTPLGYSLSGKVMAVGSGTEEFAVGQSVACAGVGYANHAEINFVPKNLVVPIPEGVDMKAASFATIGAVALHGFRRAGMQLGETACVVGLGLIGLLLVQILRAAGIEVIGVDLVSDRCEAAKKLGARFAALSGDPGLPMLIDAMTGGIGVDCIFITAGGLSNGPVELAVKLARDRARVVDIGKTKLDLPWNDYYMKELDVVFSRSYGPGRYDPTYEEGGVDYPIGYVRWTERRNMSSFLNLVASGDVRIDPLISSVHPFENAETVYSELASGKADSFGIVFQYGEEPVPPQPLSPVPQKSSPVDGKVRIGAIGAGRYACSMLLPHLRNNADACLLEVATSTGISASDAARKFGIERTTTDYRALLAADDIDAAIVTTRHSSHPRMVADSLAAGKAVFVEKPLAIGMEGLETVRNAVLESQNPRLMVGFNRRFSPLVEEIAAAFRGLNAPLAMQYRVHAGQLERGSWYLSPSEGSRFVGEAGHFFDVFAFISGAAPVSVFARTLRPTSPTRDDLENVFVSVTYSDGSVASLLYLTQGSPKVPKEYLEVFGGGRTAVLHNFEKAVFFEGNRERTSRGRGIDKGQKAEVERFVAAVKSGGDMPIPLNEIFDTTLVTLAAAESVRTGLPVDLAEYGALGASVETAPHHP